MVTRGTRPADTDPVPLALPAAQREALAARLAARYAVFCAVERLVRERSHGLVRPR